MKGSAITGPVGKEAAELWPRIASNSGVVMRDIEERTILSTGNNLPPRMRKTGTRATKGSRWIGRLCISGCGVLGSHTTA
jgi:hypothetical protein